VPITSNERASITVTVPSASFIHVARGRISKIYLDDAVVEGGFIASWGAIGQTRCTTRAGTWGRGGRSGA